MKRDVFYIALILVLFFFLHQSCNNSKSFENLYNQSTDTLTHYQNKLGQQVTITSLLYGQLDDFKKLHVADSTALGKLQKIVDKNTISATYLSNKTSNIVAGSTTIAKSDTVFKDSAIYIYPEYATSFNNQWENFKAKATKDSFIIDYKVYNEFELKQQWKSNGLLKRKTPEAVVINLNPHTETKEFKTFTIQENKGNRVRDALIGFLGGLIATETLHYLK